MKINKSRREIAEGDLTPMIDMTFQLIAFFMVLINFSQAEQDQRIKLPESELAKPPEAPLKNAITLQVLGEGLVTFDNDDYSFEQLKKRLVIEKQARSGSGSDEGSEITVIVRGDSFVQTGKVQDLIKLCQEVGFEKFALRAKEKVPY